MYSRDNPSVRPDERLRFGEGAAGDATRHAGRLLPGLFKVLEAVLREFRARPARCARVLSLSLSLILVLALTLVMASSPAIAEPQASGGTTVASPGSAGRAVTGPAAPVPPPKESGRPLEPPDGLVRSGPALDPKGPPSLSERDERDLEDALRIYSTIVAVYPGTREARQAELAASRCLEQLGRFDQAIAGYERFIEKYKGMPEGAGALLSLARLYAFNRKDIPHALTLYDRILTEYSFAPDSIDAQIDKAGCLRDTGRLGEALRLYEEVAQDYTGTEYAARALVGLGLYYQSRDERDRARSCFDKAVQECPPDSQWTRMARSRLDALGRYHFSPLYDRLMWRIESDFLVGLLRLDRLSSLSILLKLGLTQCLVRAGALTLCLLLLWALSSLSPAAGLSSGGVLQRPWSAGRMALLLAFLWSFDLALTVISTSVTWRWFPQASFRPVLGSIQEVSIYLFMIAAVLWRESLFRVLGVSRAQIWRTAALCTGAGVILVAVLGLINEVHGRLAQTGSVAVSQPWVPRIDHGSTWAGAIAFYLLVALGEECVYRGVVFQALKAQTNVWLAAILSSLLFAQVHLYPFWSTLRVFGFGLILAWVVQRTKSLAPAVLLHFLLNMSLYLFLR